MISHKHVINNDKYFVTLNLYIHNSVAPVKLCPAALTFKFVWCDLRK